MAVCALCKFRRILNGTPELSDLKVLHLFFFFNDNSIAKIHNIQLYFQCHEKYGICGVAPYVL